MRIIYANFHSLVFYVIFLGKCAFYCILYEFLINFSSKLINAKYCESMNFYVKSVSKCHFMDQFLVSLRGVVVDLSGLRDRGPGFKTRSRPLTFMKADTNFRTLHVVGFSCTNEFYRIPSCKRR